MRSQLSKKVKIVATLGPASDNPEMILKLAKSGVDIFRLNLSHRSPEETEASIRNIRLAEKKVGRPIAIMGDLAGPKVRIGPVEVPVKLVPGQKIKILSKKVPGNAEQISLNFPQAVSRLEKNSEIYIGDGVIKLKVESKIPGGVLAKVIVGGELKSRKGFSAQGIALSSFKLNTKDKDDIKLMVKLGADAIAISFVKNKKDVQSVLKLLPSRKRPFVIAKIETLEGVKNAEEILNVSDGLMVARGDLSLAVPVVEVPRIQKNLIALGLEKKKPVITATYFLQSMRYSPIPTQAEVADVATAVLHGSDALLLSAETAMGNFPLETVKMMTKIIQASSRDISLK